MTVIVITAVADGQKSISGIFAPFLQVCSFADHCPGEKNNMNKGAHLSFQKENGKFSVGLTECRRGQPLPQVLKIRSHGFHGRGTKGMLLYLLVPPKSLFCPSNSIIPEAVFIIMSKLSPKVASHVQGKVRQASWTVVYVYHCHETLNKALNDEEIVYFGTILMIKTCFGTKLMIKTWFTHFLLLIQFVAIHALLGGPIRP